MFSKKSVNMSVTCFQQDRSNGIWPLLHTAQASKQTSGDPSGQTRDYRGITLLNKFTTAKGAGSYLAGMAVAIPILNVDGRRHTNNFSKIFDM